VLDSQRAAHEGLAAEAAARLAAREGELAALAERLPSHRNGNGAALLRALAEGGGEAPPLRRARAEGAALAFRVAFCHNDLLAGNVLLLAEEAPPRVAVLGATTGAPLPGAGGIACAEGEGLGTSPEGIEKRSRSAIASNTCRRAPFPWARTLMWSPRSSALVCILPTRNRDSYRFHSANVWLRDDSSQSDTR
jgi:hypothetical protein